MALFSLLNLTFKIYSAKVTHPLSYSLRVGDAIPTFNASNAAGPISNSDCCSALTTIFNFTSSDCPHCLEQSLLLNPIATEWGGKSHKFINITSHLPSEMTAYSPAIEWIEDKDSALYTLFKVAGFPTLFVVELMAK